MLAGPSKNPLPLGEVPNVIYRVEYAADHVKSGVNLKINHILPEEFCVRNLVARNRKHSAGRI
jgi:hypothetical protein